MGYSSTNCTQPGYDYFDEKDNESSSAWIKEDGDDTDDCSEENPCAHIQRVGECFGHNTNMTVLPGEYDLVLVANLSKYTVTEPSPYFNVLGTSKNNTFIIILQTDFHGLHIVDSEADRQVLYVYEASFSIQDVTIKVNGVPDATAERRVSLVWIHGDISVVRFENVDFNGTVFPQHLFVHTGGKLTLKSVGIHPPSGRLPGNIVKWYGNSKQANHEGSWIIDGVEIKNTNYTFDTSLFEHDAAPSCVLNVSIQNSVFESITWTSAVSSTYSRLSNAAEKGLIYMAPSRNYGVVDIQNTKFIALDCSAVTKAAPVVILSSGNGILPQDSSTLPTNPPLTFSGLKFENCTGSAGAAGTIYTDNVINFEKLTSTGNNVKNVNGQSEPSNVAVSDDETIQGQMTYDKDSCSDNPDDALPMCGEADPDGFPTWALIVIIVVAVVVVAAVVVIIVVAVYFKKKKYQAMADEEEYNESSSSSLRSSEKDNEMDSI